MIQWKQAEELFDLAHFIAATRPGYDMAGFEVPGEAKDAVTVMNIPALAISSTDIRARVKAGGPIRYLVPEGVKSYIEKAGLYR
jgi:nicotinate-nucleotide adenylyltransferase